MPTAWTAEAVLALAPDAASAQAGRGLATPSKWVALGSSAEAVWGEAKGSGAKPYQVAIDLSEPAFKCSCPSRKFPCKHAIGLFLMLAQGSVAPGDAPAFVREWLEKRQTKQKPASVAPNSPDPAAQAKRAEQRRDRVRSGLEECGLWLRDTVRQGFASPSVASAQYFEGMAARMVDAQAPGIARRLREMGTIVHSGQGWQERMVEGMAALHLIIEAYARLKSLPEALRQDVLAAVGFTWRKDELPEAGHVTDAWCVVGQHRYQEDRLSVQRSWLWGHGCRRWAMVLGFSVANQPFDTLLSPGTAFAGTLAFYPGAEALRAVPLDREVIPFLAPPATDLDSLLSDFADRVARCPWTEAAPAALGDVCFAGPDWELIAPDGRKLPTVPGIEPWPWLAITGGRPATVCGEWDGRLFRPLAGVFEGRWLGL